MPNNNKEVPQEISRGNNEGYIKSILEVEKFKMPQIPREDLYAGVQALQAKDPFGTLGVSENNTSDEIEARFRELIKKLHPDIVGRRTGDFPDTFNRMTQRIIEAHEKLKDHVPPPKTLEEAAYQRYGQQEFGLKEPVEQLSIMLTVLSKFALDEIYQTMGSDIGLYVRIGNESARIYEDIDSIQRAYRGEIGFRPLDGKPLPDVENILQTLKDVEIVRSSRVKFKDDTHSREDETYFTVYQVPLPIAAGRERSGYEWVHYGSVSSDLRFWFVKFRELNRIPDLETGERLTRKTRQKQQRIRKHGRFIGSFLDFINPPSGMIDNNDERNIKDSVIEQVNVAVEDKKAAVPMLTSKNP